MNTGAGSPARLGAREILARLVGFDTVSAKSNLALIDWVRGYLAGHGVASELTWNAGRDKANLFATIGPDETGGVILSGHTDVVPVEGQPWDSDPFAVAERDGRLYGRGTADMKSFLALVLALVPEWTERRFRVPLHLAFSYDEEVGCFGVPGLIRGLPEGARRPRLAIIGEPTELRVVTAHKGVYVHRTMVTGLEAHSSSLPRGVSAIYAASEIIGEIARLGAELRAAAPKESGFDPPYTTFNIGTIAGGTAFNIVPRHCEFVWDVRLLPGDDIGALRARIAAFVEHDLLPRMQRVHPGASVVTEVLAETPALVPERDSPAEALARRLTGANATSTVAFASEAGIFQEEGIPAVLCGPGSIEQAHQPNEYITLEQFAAGERFLRRLADWAESAA